MYRFFTPLPLTLKSPVTLDDEELYHLKKVLRVRPGETIEIVNGKGQLAKALYDDVIYLTSLDTIEPPQKKSILIQAFPEKAHLEFIIEKGTELGITEFFLFPAARSKLKEISLSQFTRLKKITLSAIKQSKRLFLPEINVQDITDIKKIPCKLYLADPDGGPFTPSHESSGFIVGPESGFTKAEIDFFQKTLNALPTKLSSNILRTETAAIAASFLLTTS